MPHANFVHLAVHSAYSLSEGAIKPKGLVDLAAKADMPALGVADTGNLFGALEFSQAAAEAGVQPIMGCRLAVRREEPARGHKIAAPDQLTLIVRDAGGWTNLMKLVSAAYLGTDAHESAQVPLDLVERHAGGLIALSGGRNGAIFRLLAEGQAEPARELAARLAKAFAGAFYIEIGRHGLDDEARVEGGLLDIAYRLDVPLVAINEVFFRDTAMFDAHDALMCIAQGRYVAETDRPRLTPEFRFKTAAEMRALFADLPEACDNTLVIARRCSFRLRETKPMLPVPPVARERGPEAILREAAAKGLEERLAATAYTSDMTASAKDAVAKPYRERLAFELEVIVKMGFAGYFLIVADFIQWAKRHDIPVGPGRGSGAGSVVAWSLTITDLDPLRFGLLFERFLNPERISMPDFDVDFCQERRDEVVRYVQQEYGADRVAQIITFGKLQARAVVRNVGRVLGLPLGLVDRIAKLVPNNPAKPISLKDAIAGESQLQEFQRNDEAVARMLEIAMALEGLYRNASTHAAGIVIGDRPLDELVPLYRDPRSSMPATQFNLKYVELAGLVKFDFLGLKTLTVLQEAARLLAAGGRPLDLAHLPLDDRPTFAMLGRAETVGVFQFEGAGMRDAMRQLKPDRFEDLIALVALYRPGPMQDIPRYIACKHGTEKPDYLHPKLEPILKETFGVMVYQEQVMQIAQVLAGYTLGTADLLRRAMGKKIRSEMQQQRGIFVKGAIERGVDEAQAGHIFDLMERFADYGFNKCHSAPYALVAYQTAYLKANHPVEFIAASMSFDIGNIDKLNVFRQELDRLAIKLLPPDINASAARFAVEQTADGAAVRYALAALKNVGLAAMNAVVAEREANGRFKDLADFARRVDPKLVNRGQMESLVKAGAFDSLERNRGRVFAAIEGMLALAQRSAEDRASHQSSLFGARAEVDLVVPKAEDWPLHERLARELEAVGFYLSAHPLDAYATGLRRLGVVRAAELPATLAATGSRRVKLAGTVIGRQERTTSKGTRMAFVQMSDASGMFEVTVFSEALGKSRDLLTQGKPLLITANAELADGNIRIRVDDIAALDDAVAQTAAGLRITVNDVGPLEKLKAMIAAERSGRGRVSIVLDLGEAREVEIALPQRRAVSPMIRVQLGEIAGVTAVEEV